MVRLVVTVVLLVALRRAGRRMVRRQTGCLDELARRATLSSGGGGSRGIVALLGLRDVGARDAQLLAERADWRRSDEDFESALS